MTRVTKAAPTALGPLGRIGRPAAGLPGLGGPPAPASRPPFSPQAPLDQVALAPTAPAKSALSADHLYELGLTTAAMSFHTAAIEALRDCVRQAPNHAAAWRKLAELSRLAREDAEAEAAEAQAERASTKPQPKSAAGDILLIRADKAERRLRDRLWGVPPDEAMAVLRERLIADPTDVAAMRLLARLEARADDSPTAWRLLKRALDLCPGYVGAREDLAESLLERRAQAAAAAEHTQRLLDHAPRNPRYRRMHAYALMFAGQLEHSAEILAGLVEEAPKEATFWSIYGRALHFLGRREESARAFRRCLELKPSLGEAWFGLADLKGGLITNADVAAMRAHLAEEALPAKDRMHMLYALAQTLERSGDHAASFADYSAAARLSRQLASEAKKGHDRRESAERVRRMKRVFSRENLEALLPRAPAAAPATTPIFIVGMPRAGSTLVEQILASHSKVEGTRELPIVGDITRALGVSRVLATPDAYPECVPELSADKLASLGAGLVEAARLFRRTDRPYFIDKRPWNWLDAGLIRLIAPQARIIDIRRDPMAACFAMYKQMLPTDAAFSDDLEDLGAYYNNYVSLMEHWRDVLPGWTHFVRYEDLVTDTESEIRRMLDFCGLAFEEGCLRFWETDRAVSTPSAEQVRRPIFRDALEQWRRFEPWLGPLRDSLSRPAEA